MLLHTAVRNNRYATRRIVAATVVTEKSLPYNLLECDTPERLEAFWHGIVAAEPDHEPEKENMVVVMLNTRLRPIAWNRVSIGTVNECSAHPREVLRPVIAAGAYAFAVMHNHPSGEPDPSRADEAITRRIDECAKLLQIRFLDHLVIGRSAPGRASYFSFREAGIIS